MRGSRGEGGLQTATPDEGERTACGFWIRSCFSFRKGFAGLGLGGHQDQAPGIFLLRNYFLPLGASCSLTGSSGCWFRSEAGSLPWFSSMESKPSVLRKVLINPRNSGKMGSGTLHLLLQQILLAFHSRNYSIIVTLKLTE